MCVRRARARAAQAKAPGIRVPDADSSFSRTERASRDGRCRGRPSTTLGAAVSRHGQGSLRTSDPVFCVNPGLALLLTPPERVDSIGPVARAAGRNFRGLLIRAVSPLRIFGASGGLGRPHRPTPCCKLNHFALTSAAQEAVGAALPLQIPRCLPDRQSRVGGRGSAYAHATDFRLGQHVRAAARPFLGMADHPRAHWFGRDVARNFPGPTLLLDQDASTARLSQMTLARSPHPLGRRAAHASSSPSWRLLSRK